MSSTNVSVLILLFFLLTGSISNAQNVGINEDGSSPNAKAMLDVKSNTKGLLIPRMSTAERLAISPTMSEQGIMVFDTSISAFFYHTGTEWKEVSEALWTKDPIGINRQSHVGINTVSNGRHNLYVFRPEGVTGADTSNIYAYRGGVYNNTTGGGGTNFSRTGVDAAIKGLSDYGNPFSAAIAGYGYLDYNNSAALIGSNNGGTMYGILGFRDPAGVYYAGYFKGDSRFVGDGWFDNRVGIGITPNTSYTLNVQSSSEDRAGYFSNTKSSSASTFGIYAGASGAGSGNKNGGSFRAIGGTGQNRGVNAVAQNGGSNIAVYAYAAGGTTNWAAHFDSGDVIIDDRVGIGTQTIATGVGLHVMDKDIRMEGANDFFDIISTSTSNLNGIRFYNTSSTFQGAMFYSAASDLLNITNNSNNPLLVADFGSAKVCIGTYTTATGYILNVGGKIISEELRIQDVGSWPDYVFADDYELMSLEQLENSISTHKHLPNIPSAKVVEEEGILVGDMQKRMIEKIEELTLYVIEINKQNQALNKEVQVLKTELKELQQN